MNSPAPACGPLLPIPRITLKLPALAGVLGLLLVALSPQARGGGEELISKVYDPTKTRSEIRVTTLASHLPPSGYMAVRVYLKNATKIPRSWRLDFTSSDANYGTDGNEMTSDFEFSCPPNQVRTFEILVPLVTSFVQYHSDVTELRVRATSPGFPSASGSMSTEYSSNWPAILISDELDKVSGSMLRSQVSGVLSGSHGSSPSVEFGAAFAPGDMYGDWRAYSGYDFCLITEEEWKQLGPGPQSALLRWNRMGGGLLIYSENPSTDLSSLGIPGIEPGPKSSLRSWGIARIEPLPSDKRLPAAATVNMVSRELPRTIGRNRLQTLREDFNGSWELQKRFGTKTAHVALFILVLLAFGILVGPINLFVFAKAGQRHRLFITTPIISLSASLILVVLILFQDGFGGRGQQLILMEVRSGEGENAAYVSQEQVCRTGVLLSTGFTTTEPCTLSQALLAESRWARATATNHGGGSRYSADVTDKGLRVTGDWFKSRSEHGHYMETVRPSRGRIELKPQTSPPEITSTFSFPLGEVIFTDEEGNYWRAENVPQGRRTTMKELSKGDFRAWKNEQRSLFSERNRSRVDMTVGRRGHFAATSPEVPAIGTLPSINWQDPHALITGSVLTN